MDVDAFLQSISAADLQLPRTSTATASAHAPETIDALFHLPLLALAVMVIVRRKPFLTLDLGRNVAMLLVEHFSGLRHSPHGLETSLTLCRRCAHALAFLEAGGLAIVSQNPQRIVSLTPNGKKHLDRAGRNGDDLGMLVRQLRTNQERVRARIGGNER